MKAFIFLIAISMIVALAIWLPHLMLNPGKLSSGHQEIENDCSSCHELFSGISNNKCIACHKPAEIGKDSSADKTASLAFHSHVESESCTSCHTDHKGKDPALSTFSFDHKILSATTLANCKTCDAAPTDSLHAKFSISCGSCHHTREWKFEGKFDHEQITGTHKNNCNSCHEKPTDDLHLSLTNCADCHGTNQWSPATFDHSNYFVLDRDHNAKCNTCHTSAKNYKLYSCYTCHEHSEAKIAREHREEGISNFTDCASCHRSGDKHDIRSREVEKNNTDVERIRDYVQPRKEEKEHKEHDDD
jgi:hypothetical protein